MNVIVTAEQMKAAEQYMINEVGMPAIVLMEKAADRIAEEILDLCERGMVQDNSVTVLCGCGNNGGDGMAVARILKHRDMNVGVYIVGNEEKATEEFHMQKDMFVNLGGHILDSPDYDAGLVIDAIFGIGLSRNIDGKYLEVINKLNEVKENNGTTIVSIDIPSGLNADTGKIMGTCVKADYTICLGYTKAGIYLNDGPDFTGEVSCHDIGIEYPKEYIAVDMEPKDVRNFMPKRWANSNKSSYGKVTIIAGSAGMPGAAVLASRAALLSGAGMVRLLTDELVIPQVVDAMPEVMIGTYNDRKAVSAALEWSDAILIGPGLGREMASEELFLYVMDNCDKPMVIDADGLFHLVNYMDILGRRRSVSTILTPHPGEFARLFKTGILKKKNQDIEYVKSLAKEYGVIILAKDHHSVITDGDLAVINTYGTDALATAGTGDVLAGLALTMMVNMDDDLDAAALASIIHGIAGRLAEEDANAYSVTASDVANHLPEAINCALG